MREPTIIRSARRKTMSICVKEDLTVEVRIPTYVSKQQALQFVEKNQAWIAAQLQRQSERNAVAKTVTPEEEAALRIRAKKELPPRIAYFSGQMGLMPTGFRVTGARTRLGSCSGKNSLCFSFRLMAYPQSAIDYVIVHELAHIRHKNHGKSFYGLIAPYLPDYKIQQSILHDPQYRIL